MIYVLTISFSDTSDKNNNMVISHAQLQQRQMTEEVFIWAKDYNKQTMLSPK